MKKLSWILVLAFSVFACDMGLNTQDENTLLNTKSQDLITAQLYYGAPQTGNGTYPYENYDGLGGYTSCEDLPSLLGISEFNYTSGLMDLSMENFPLVVGPITIELLDGKYLSWSSTEPVMAAFILKGDRNLESNIYYYGECTTGDAGLATPIFWEGSVPLDVKYLSVCWTLCEDDEEKCYEDETAWAAGSRFVTKGNWATYTAYSGTEKTVTLYAGQTMVAGTVEFSNAIGGYVTVTISLNEGWKFNDLVAETENIHIMPYMGTPAAVNPAPGKFTYKFIGDGTYFSESIPYSSAVKFFGIHTAVLREVECPVTE